jgi:uncharacterized RDD family membrane protein YckC
MAGAARAATASASPGPATRLGGAVSLAADRGPAVVHAARVAEESVAPIGYSGIVTRAIAFAIDALVIQFVAIAVAGTFALILSVVSPSDRFDSVIVAVGTVAYVLWLVGYFVVFWSTTGQTPGNRLLEIRVCRAADGELIGLGAALVRFAGIILAAIPLFAGFIPILLNDRRRGLQDMLAGTVVVAVPRPSAQ